MTTTTEIGHQQICGWLSGLYIREVDQAQLEAYLSGAAAPFLAAIAQGCDCRAEQAEFEQAVTELAGLDNAARDLAADYAALFLLFGSQAAPPYASLYGAAASTTMLGAAHDRMVARFNAAGLASTIAANEPADHIAFMLEYLGLLHSGEVQSETPQGFVASELAPWIDAFDAKMRASKTSTGFYQAVGQLTCCYLKSLK